MTSTQTFPDAIIKLDGTVLLVTNDARDWVRRKTNARTMFPVGNVPRSICGDGIIDLMLRSPLVVKRVRPPGTPRHRVTLP